MAASLDQYLRGVELFNAGEFFECHEVLEEVWLKSEGAEREFLHALIQSAAALHHYQQGNLKGASGVYRRARRKFQTLPPAVLHLDVQAFADQLEQFFSLAIKGERTAPALPKIRLSNQ